MLDDNIHIKTGALNGRTEMPALSYDKDKGSELGYRSDEEALYIGTSSGNKRLCGVKDVGELSAKIEALNTQIRAITARLDALEKPDE